jgi:hypothetical protein
LGCGRWAATSANAGDGWTYDHAWYLGPAQGIIGLQGEVLDPPDGRDPVIMVVNDRHSSLPEPGPRRTQGVLGGIAAEAAARSRHGSEIGKATQQSHPPCLPFWITFAAIS